MSQFLNAGITNLRLASKLKDHLL